MMCDDWIQRIVECARSGAGPDADLRLHLVMCPACEERFESERLLSAQLKVVRIGAVREARRRERLPLPVSSHPRRTWQWAAAAALVVGLVAAGGRHRFGHPVPNVVAVEVDTADEFVPVPYMPPLAPGEFVQVVQVDLPAEEVAELGFDIEGTAPGMVPVDLMLGQDDVPRALRILHDESY